MDWYLIFKSLHIIAVICWMVGLFYLPRLFVYHTEVQPGSEAYEKFNVMEHKLLKIIMNPSMIATWFFGIGLVVMLGHEIGMTLWMKVKLISVLILSGYHGYLAKCRKSFLSNSNVKSAKFFRILNEVPSVLLVLIVFMVVFQPK